MSGPFKGVGIIELGGIGPAPFCEMMLTDQGATVIRVERPGTLVDPRDPLSRSRRLLMIDLKHPAAANTIRALSMQSDGMIEGFRPGVAERLGLGPGVLLDLEENHKPRGMISALPRTEQWRIRYGKN